MNHFWIASFSRVYTALCRGKGEIERFKDFLVQFVSDINHAKNLPSVLITCYCIWPKFFCITKDKQEMNTDYVKENPVVNSIPVIATWLASENGQIKQEKVPVIHVTARCHFYVNRGRVV